MIPHSIDAFKLVCITILCLIHKVLQNKQNRCVTSVYICICGLSDLCLCICIYFAINLLEQMTTEYTA